jgi:predicted aspartyl protease
MVITVDYDGRHAWRGAKTYYSNRPYGSIDVSYAGSAAVNLWALLDTGADYLCLDDAVAKSIGINLRASTNYVAVTTPLGATASLPLWTVRMTIEGRSADVDAIFDSSFATTPLLGRAALLDAIKFGIDVTGWLYADP